MEPSAMPDGMFQFGAFEIDNRSGELRKHGVRIKVQATVTRKGGWFTSESQDGNFLYYTKNIDNNDDLSGLWELPIRGGDERLVLESLSSRSFDVTGQGIYYISTPSGRRHFVPCNFMISPVARIKRSRRSTTTPRT